LTLPYSTSPVEGYIHRLKLIKRQAYGRASLSYLQQRFFSVAWDKRQQLTHLGEWLVDAGGSQSAA
jgi:hypothetical protein